MAAKTDEGIRSLYSRLAELVAQLSEANDRIAELEKENSVLLNKVGDQGLRIGELRAERDEACKVLEGFSKYAPTGVIACSGSKCRLPWCESCNDEEDAKYGLHRAQGDFAKARALATEAGKAGVLTKWQPIETAPDSGERFLVYIPGFGPLTAHYDEGFHFHSTVRFSWKTATHWMPLPEPPK